MAFHDDVKQAVMSGAKDLNSAPDELETDGPVFDVPETDVVADNGDVIDTKAGQDPAPKQGPVDTAAAKDSQPADDKKEGKFSDQLMQLSEAYGVPANDFSTENDLRAAIRFAATQIVQQGRQDIPDQTPAKGDPSSDAPTKEDELDISSLDPAVAKHLKALMREKEEAKTRLQEIEQRAEVERQQQVREGWERIAKTAIKVMDSVASPDLGVGEDVTYAQHARREAVFKTAGQIINGLLSSGRQVPDIEKIMVMALDLHSIQKPVETKGTKPSMQGKSSSDAAARVVKVNPQIRPHDKLGLMRDPKYLQGLNSIFAGR